MPDGPDTSLTTSAAYQFKPTNVAVPDYAARIAIHSVQAGPHPSGSPPASDTNPFPTPRSRSRLRAHDLAVGVEAQVEAEVAVLLGLVMSVGLSQRGDEVAEPVDQVGDLRPGQPPRDTIPSRPQLRQRRSPLACEVVIQPATTAGSAPASSGALYRAILASHVAI
jgi:hypothetical protein